jgi:hypothetical protein
MPKDFHYLFVNEIQKKHTNAQYIIYNIIQLFFILLATCLLTAFTPSS